MDNLRGSVLMILAMAAFALEDTFIKLLAAHIPVGQILLMLGFGGSFVYATIILLQRKPLFTRDALSAPVLLRGLGEMIAAFGYLTAITLIPLSTASAILQATSLAVTLGAALFMGENVGWRRWSAIFVGFIGVLMIIRPGLDGFEPASIFAVIGVVGLALRDLSTRMTPSTVSSMQLSGYAFATLIPTGLVMLIMSGETLELRSANITYMILALLFSVSGYYAIVAAMRVGDVSSVTPFRYTRLIFALIIGITIFGERPDQWTIIGAAIIICSGFYILLRENRIRQPG